VTLGDGLGAFAAITDALILFWLVATWFWEGNHRRCSVKVTCSRCGCLLPEIPCTRH
jgi:hypothetical protein